MIMKFSIISAAAILVLQLGCAPAQPPGTADTRATDEKAIRDGEAQWVKDFAAKDVERVAAHYADDGYSMIPDMTIMKNKDAIRAGLKEEFSDPNCTLDFHPDKVEVAKSGDIAYSQGNYSYSSTDPKTKKRLIEHGGYVEVYKKQADGSWKVAEDIATQEARPALEKSAK
jgi:uncharacterized protein (TIGR02246 family)